MTQSPAYQLYIINKHGSLVYQKDFTNPVKLSVNDRIRLASTFHGLSAIASQLSPVKVTKNGKLGFLFPRGISVIEGDTFKLYCHETLTGLKFFVVSPQNRNPNLESNLRMVYDL